MLEQIALALAGRAGEWLAGRLGLSVGRSTLLRLVRALPDPQPTTAEVLGVDDFALRRGHNYGSVLVDMATHHHIPAAQRHRLATQLGEALAALHAITAPELDTLSPPEWDRFLAQQRAGCVDASGRPAWTAPGCSRSRRSWTA